MITLLIIENGKLKGKTLYCVDGLIYLTTLYLLLVALSLWHPNWCEILVLHTVGLVGWAQLILAVLSLAVAPTQRNRMQGGVMGGRRDYETGSSDLETTSFVDSEDDHSRCVNLKLRFLFCSINCI